MPAIKPTSPALQGNAQAIGLTYFAVCFEGSGTTLHDLSTGANNGTVPPGIWGTGQFSGPDLAIGGTTGNVAILPATTGFARSGDFSVSCWVKLTANTSQCFAAAYSAAGGGAGWAIGCNDDSSGKIKFYTSNGTGNETTTSTTVLTTGVWHHVVCTFTAAAGVKRIYLDNVLDRTSASGTITPTYPAGTYASVGGAASSASAGFQPTLGQVDAVALYNYVLPASGGVQDSVSGIYADPFTAARPPVYLFQDSFQLATPGTYLAASGYVPTNLDGSAGSGSWASYGQLVVTADHGVRGTGHNGAQYNQCSAAPESPAYRVGVEIKLNSIPNINFSAYGVSHADLATFTGLFPPIPAHGYLWGITGDGSGGVEAQAIVASGNAYVSGSTIPLAGAAAGSVYSAWQDSAVSGGNLITSFSMTRASDGHYLTPSGAFQAAAIAAWTYTDATILTLADPAPRAYAGLQIYNPALSDSAEAEIKQFSVVDLSPPASLYHFGGPASGGLGVPSSPFTVQPNGPSSETLTPSDGGAGGIFSPASFTWSGDAIPRTFTYSAGSASATLTLAGTSLPITPASLTYTAPALAEIDRCWIDPTGNLLLLSAKLVSGGTPVNITAATSGGTLTPSAGGETAGAPIALANPLWTTDDPFVIYPLRQGINPQYTDDLSATFAGTGWLTRDVREATAYGQRYYFAGYTPSDQYVYDSQQTRWQAGQGIVFGDTFRETPTHTDTATYTISGLTPGRNVLSQLLWSIAGPDRTTAARYTVVDGHDGTTVVGTFTVDQTQPYTALFDRLQVIGSWPSTHGYHFADIGAMTIQGTSVIVTVANANTSGNLVVDCLLASYEPLPAVPPGGSATVSLPSGTFLTTAGAIATLVNQPATLTTDAQWSPAPTSAAAKLGYNIMPSHYDQIARAPADRARDCGRWLTAGGHPYGYVDQYGNLVDATTMGGATPVVNEFGAWPYRHVITPWNNGEFDNFGLITGPPSSTWRVTFTYSGTGTPVVYFNGGNTGAATITNLSGTTWQLTQECDNAFTPVSRATSQWSPGWNPDLALVTQSLITNLHVYDGNNPGTTSADGTVPQSWPHATHPGIMRQLAGFGFTLRFLDFTQGAGSNVVNFGDLPGPLLSSNDVPNSTPVITITSIAPVDTSPTNADGALSWSSGARAGFGMVKAVTAAPHGLATGQYPTVTYSGTDGFPCAGGLAGKLWLQGKLADGSAPNAASAYRVVVVDATTLLMQLYYYDTTGGVSGYSGPAIATLAASHSLTGATLQIMPPTGLNPFSDALAMVKETGSDGWFNVNEIMSQQGMSDMFDAILAGTNPGQRIYIEPSNEIWNYYGPTPNLWFNMYQPYLASLPGGPRPMDNVYHAYCYSCVQVWTVAMQRFALAGRSADLVRVIGAQEGYATTTQDYCDWFFANRSNYGGVTFDVLSIGSYVPYEPPSAGQWNGSGGNAAAAPALGRLDIGDHVSVWSQMVQGNCWSNILNNPSFGHRTILNSAPYRVGGTSIFAGVKINSYEGGMDDLSIGITDGNVSRMHAMVRHPRMYQARLAWSAAMERGGFSGFNIYTLNYSAVHQGNDQWFHLDTYNQVGSKADGSDGLYNNANPSNLPLVVAPQLKAMQDYMSLPSSPSAATSYTLAPASASAPAGVASTFTLTPNGVYTGTVTVAVTGSAVASPATLTWSASSSSQAFTVTDATAQTVTISASNSGGLTNPASATLTVTPALATALALAPTAATTPVGVPATFTVTPNGPYTGTASIAVTGSATRSTATLTWSSSAAAQAFTVSDATAQAVTITLTNSGGLTNPPPATLTVVQGTTLSGSDIAAIAAAVWAASGRALSAGVDIASIMGNTTAATNLMAQTLAQFNLVVSNDSSATTTQFTANATTSPGLSTISGEYTNAIIAFYAGNNVPCARKIANYTYSGGIGTFTVTPALRNLPATDGTEKASILGFSP